MESSRKRALKIYSEFYNKSGLSPLLEAKGWGNSKYGSFSGIMPIRAKYAPNSNDICLNCPDRYTKLIREHDTGRYLLEALIKTYPPKYVLKDREKWLDRILDKDMLELRFEDLIDMKELEFIDQNIKPHDKISEKYTSSDENYKDGIPRLLTFYMPIKTSDEEKATDQLKKFADALYYRGWNLSNYELLETQREDIGLFVITVEPKYADADFEFGETMYHVTPVDYLKKIAKQGIIPKSSNRKFKYPDRVYLFNNAPLSLITAYAIEKIQDLSDRFAVLRIDSIKLRNDQLYKNGKMKFYIDGKFSPEDPSKPIAIYTYNNIPGRLLENNLMIYSVDDGRITDVKNGTLDSWK